MDVIASSAARLLQEIIFYTTPLEVILTPPKGKAAELPKEVDAYSPDTAPLQI